MAKNTGVLKFSGKIGDLVYYRRNGVDIVQRVGGFNGDRIKSEERYLKTRQLSNEFGKCASVASIIKKELSFYLRRIPDAFVYSRIQKMLVSIKNCDISSDRGQRTIFKGLMTTEGKRLLQGFSFNREKHLSAVLGTSFEADLNSGTFKMPCFNPCTEFKFPKGESAGALCFVLMRIDLDECICTTEASKLFVFSKCDTGRELCLKAVIPQGDGILIGLLFAGICRVENNMTDILRTADNVLEVIAFEN